MCPNLYDSFICNKNKWEITKVPFNGWMNCGWLNNTEQQTEMNTTRNEPLIHTTYINKSESNKLIERNQAKKGPCFIFIIPF